MTPPSKRAVRSRDNSEISSASKSASSTLKAFTGRDGLAAYLNYPSSFPDRLLYHTPSFVAIKDLYPKSSVHILLLPYTSRSTLHPFSAFEDSDLLASCKSEIANVKKLAAVELRRLHGKHSFKDRARLAAMEEDFVHENDQLPDGRNWEDELMVGVHSGPSMNHLHIHVISRDRHSEYLKHRKHYNSFATPFFVHLEELPLPADDPRWKKDRGGWLKVGMSCWRCGKDFGNRFAELKRHLEAEFVEWRKE